MCHEGSIGWTWPLNAIKAGGSVPSFHIVSLDFRFYKRSQRSRVFIYNTWLSFLERKRDICQRIVMTSFQLESALYQPSEVLNSLWIYNNWSLCCLLKRMGWCIIQENPITSTLNVHQPHLGGDMYIEDYMFCFRGVCTFNSEDSKKTTEWNRKITVLNFLINTLLMSNRKVQ